MEIRITFICLRNYTYIMHNQNIELLFQTTMPGMKRDCGGAAAVLGAFYLAVKQVSYYSK